VKKLEKLCSWINDLPPILAYPLIIGLLFVMACLYSIIYNAAVEMTMAIRVFILG